MKKILIAEDDKFLQNVYSVKFTKAGYKVFMASNGNEALKLIEQNAPDLILLDLVMPGKDGFSFLEDYSKNSKMNKIPVIVTSNLGQQEDIDKALKLGAKDYVIKSDMALSGLLEKVANILS